MCWSMCAEYRYCSPMSWIGQSLAAHSSTIAPAKQPHVAPGDDRLADADGVRADDADHVDVRAGQEGDEQPDLGVGLEPERVHDDLGEHPSSLPRRRPERDRAPVEIRPYGRG